jgi:hypothetical protein
VGGGGLRNLTAVKGFARGQRDQAQCACRFGQAKTFTHLRRAAMWQEGLGESGLRGDLGQRAAALCHFCCTITGTA